MSSARRAARKSPAAASVPADVLVAKALSLSDLPVDTAKLARFLIGKTLVRELRGTVLAGRIVETEAYPVGDAAGHAFRGQTRANRSLFLGPGRAYMYFIYGSCWCLNVTSEREGIGGGVLLRALEPIGGIAAMRRAREAAFRARARGKSPAERTPKKIRYVDIARGPGRLTVALSLDGRFDGIELCTGGEPLWLADEARPLGQMGISTRIGLSREAHRRLRFYERGSPFVSGSLALRK